MSIADRLKEGDVWASDSRRTKVLSVFTRNNRWRVRYSGGTGKPQEAWADVYLRKRTLVERDGKPTARAGADNSERVRIEGSKAAKAIFDYRAALLDFSGIQASTQRNLAYVGNARLAAIEALGRLVALDPNEMIRATLSACANSAECMGLYSLGLSLLPDGPDQGPTQPE